MLFFTGGLSSYVPVAPTKPPKPPTPKPTPKPTKPPKRKPAKTTKPTKPAKTPKPTKPAKIPKPTKPAKTPKPIKPAKTPKPTKPPKPTEPQTEPPTIPPGVELTTADGPTTEPEDPTCAKQKAKFAAQNLPGIDEPKIDKWCRFRARQCNTKRCWCVNIKSGKVKGDGFNFPKSEPYHCIGKWN